MEQIWADADFCMTYELSVIFTNNICNWFDVKED